MSSYNLEKLHVLVVEKNGNLRRLVCEVLRQLGIKSLQSTAEIREAFEMFSKFPADLVFTDWSPGLDGIEFLNMIRQHEESRDVYVPVIMVTAFTEIHHVCAARDAGINEFLAKPFSARHIYARIKSVIENPRLFVRNDGVYFGPDRRRRKIDWGGKERRAHTNRSAERRKRQAPIPHSERRGKPAPELRAGARA